MLNTYTGKGFFEFFITLFQRVFSGQILAKGLLSDELQLAVLGFVALSASLLGVLVTLRKKAMLANALSHTALVGVIAAFLILGGSFKLSLPVLGLAAFMSAALTVGASFALERFFSLRSEGAIGLAFTTLFSLGILLATLFTKSTHIGLETVMGNADALHSDDLAFSSALFLVCGSVIALFYHKLKITTFDSKFASILGFRTGFYEIIILGLLSAVVMGGFRCVGVVMVLAYLAIPPSIARLFCTRFHTSLIVSSVSALFSVFIGVALSRAALSNFALPLSTGGVCTCTLSVFFVLALIIAGKKKVAFSSSL